MLQGQGDACTMLGAGVRGPSSSEGAALCPAAQAPTPQGLDGEGTARGRTNAISSVLRMV